MKTALLLLFLALFVAVYAADECNPNGNGKPDCTGRSGQISRNFWDPTHFWQCDSTGEASLVPCNATYLFDAESGSCIIWSSWEWTPPCPEVTA